VTVPDCLLLVTGICGSSSTSRVRRIQQIAHVDKVEILQRAVDARTDDVGATIRWGSCAKEIRWRSQGPTKHASLEKHPTSFVQL
jgi:hypothetical protein